jgi:hypothetical protein
VHTARTEVTDPTLIFGERHLPSALAEYASHYNRRRPHRSRQLHPPRPDHPAADLSQDRIRRRPVLGGLLNEYQRAAQKTTSIPPADFWNPAGSTSRRVRWPNYRAGTFIADQAIGASGRTAAQLITTPTQEVVALAGI